jgi:hypothetical protein
MFHDNTCVYANKTCVYALELLIYIQFRVCVYGTLVFMHVYVQCTLSKNVLDVYAGISHAERVGFVLVYNLCTDTDAVDA